MRVSDLKPAEYNPRKISPDQKHMLLKAMLEFGDLSGIVFNTLTGNLIGGHQRVSLFDPSFPIIKEPHEDTRGTVALGYVDTPYGRWVYREVEWDVQKEKMANIAANNQGGENDYTLLTMLIEDIDDGYTDMDLLGFDEKELEKLMTWTAADKANEEKSHQQLRQELQQRVQDEDPDTKHTVKVNLTGALIEYLDVISKTRVMSRSEAVRLIIEDAERNGVYLS